MVKNSLCGLSVDDIMNCFMSSGITYDHALSIAHNIYRKHISDISLFVRIPHHLREELLQTSTSGILFPVESKVSADKSVKYIFSSGSGKDYETVYIPEGKRNTVCVSTQSGCRMGCTFCHTAKYGFKGNLTAGEIVNQIVSLPYADKVTHVVFMGMGEPMDNLENVMKACDIISAEWGLAISTRHITVSTVGITPGIEKFLAMSSCNVTLSLFSPFSDERLKAIPVEKKYPVSTIVGVMKRSAVKKKRRLSLAYVMIKNINDTDRHLEEIKLIVRNSHIRVNLLPYNTDGSDQYCSSSDERMQYFKHNLIISGISASIRKSRGADISAACGLLASGLVQQLEH